MSEGKRGENGARGENQGGQLGAWDGMGDVPFAGGALPEHNDAAAKGAEEEPVVERIVPSPEDIIEPGDNVPRHGNGVRGRIVEGGELAGPVVDAEEPVPSLGDTGLEDGSNTGTPSEDDIAYQKTLEAMSQRGKDHDPVLDNALNGTPLESGTTPPAREGNRFSYYPRGRVDANGNLDVRLEDKERGLVKEAKGERGETNEEYSLRNKWMTEMTRWADQNPLQEGEHYQQWKERVGAPSFEEWKAAQTRAEEPIAAEGGEGNKSKYPGWTSLSLEQKKKLIHDYPRMAGEKTDEWMQRLEGILGGAGSPDSGAAPAEGNPDADTGENPDENPDAEDNPEAENDDAEKQEKAEHEKLLRQLTSKEMSEWLNGRYTVNELDKLSNEELQALIDEYNEKEKNDAEEKEKAEHERLLRIVTSKDFSEWLKDRYTVKELDDMSNEELQALIDEYNRSKTGGEGKDDGKGGKPSGEKEPKEVDDPLVAVALNREKDARDAAHDIAKHLLEQRKVEKGLAYRVIFGTMFREATLQHYEKKAYEMIAGKQRGETSNLSEQDWATKAGLETFVQAHVRGLEEEMIHGAAGEKMDTYGLSKGEDGKDVVTHYWVDEGGQRHEEQVGNDSPEGKATITMHEAIAKYAQTGDKRAFQDAITTLNQELAQAGGNPDALMADNYMAVAEAARDRAEHGKSIEDVMDGFRFINGEARTNIRTEAHRDALDRITNRLANSKLGKFLPPEAIGTAASAAVFLGKSNVRTALVAAGTVAVGATAGAAFVPIAVGAGIAGITSAIKERSRITGDRATQARDLARGQEASDAIVPTTGKRRAIRAAEKAKRYGDQMAEVQYDTVGATDLTNSLNEAINSGDVDRITKVFAQADTLVKMSDSRGIDLIDYSNADADIIANERMQLDIARATAKVKLRELGVDNVMEHAADAITNATETLENDIDAKDKAFRKLRRRRSAAQGLKSAIVSGAFSIGFSEAAAMVDQNQVGLVETGVNRVANRISGHELTQNAADAKNTFLAGLVGLKQVSNTEAILHEGAELTEAQRAQYENDPNYTVTQGEYKTVTTTEELSRNEALEALPDGYRSNWLSNGTEGSDGNELRGYFNAEQGVHTKLTGESWGGGQRIEVSDLTSDNSGFVVNFGGVTKYIPASGANGEFVPDLSGQPQWVADAVNGRHFDNISFVYNNGVDESGAVMGSSFWTFSGDGNLPDTVTSTVEATVPTYNVVQHITEATERDVATAAFVPGAVSRTDLPPLKPRDGKKPDNIGGVPRTHTENDGGDDNPEGPKGPDGSGNPEGDAPKGGDNGPDNPSGPKAPGGTQIPAPTPPPGGVPRMSFEEVKPNSSDEPTTENNPDGTGSAENRPGGAGTAENKPTGETAAPAMSTREGAAAETGSETQGAEAKGEAETEFQPIRYNSEVSTIDLSDDELKARAEKMGKPLSDYDLYSLRRAIETWNAAEPIYRSRAIDGRRLVDKRTMADYGPNMPNTAAEILAEYGLVVKEPDIKPGEAGTAAQAEAPDNPAETTAENSEAGEQSEVNIEPIRLESESYTINVSDDQLKALAKKAGIPTESSFDMHKLNNAVKSWNLMSQGDCRYALNMLKRGNTLTETNQILSQLGLIA